MAIIQSILVGKGKGKIGNVVLTTLKGQTVAKALNPSPANPKTPLQVASRNRMSNAVMAYKYLAGFLVHWLGVAKSTESLYNAFVSAAKNLFTDEIAGSLPAATAQLGTASLAGSSSTSITSMSFLGADVVVEFNTSGLPKPVGLRVRAIGFDSFYGVSAIADREVSNLEWTSGSLNVANLATGHDHSAAYLYSPADKKSSNILFFEQ